MIINVIFKKSLSLHKSVTKVHAYKKQELCFIITCSLTNVKRVKNMAVIWLLSLLFLISILITAVKRTKQSDGRQPPSPPGLPFIGNLHQLGPLPHQSLWELSKKYGPVMLVKLGRVPTVVVSSPDTAKQVLRDHDLNCCSRPSVEGARKLSYNFRDIAFSRYDDYWKELRKLCVMELFSTKQVNLIQPIKKMEMKKLIHSITESAYKKTPVNLSETFLSLNANVVCKASFGVSFQGTVLNNEKFQALVHEAIEMLGSFSASDFFPYIGWIFDWFTGLHARRERSVRDLDAFYEQMIDLHLQKNREERSEDDFVDLLLKLEKEEAVLGYGKLTRNHIKAILMNILLGGINTSAITMTWAMAELARNPRVMKKVQSEIRDQIGKNKEARIISLDETDKLKYLKMVIKETWRLHPVSPLLVAREVISEFKINGYTIQPKTRLHVNTWGTGRDPEIWKDPKEFIPERFMDRDIEANGQHFELLPFGGGRRICPAMYMGATTVEFGLANLLYQFDWKIPEGVEDVDMDEASGLTSHKKHDLLLVPVKSFDF
ncbi:cytochrome P450 71B10 [Brassica rapa]|nr:cytochrome P450 71B10 [Brassica rapa]